MADKKMEAQISVEFEEATSRQSLNSGETINTLWGKVKRWLSDLKSVCFSGSYNDLSDRPTTATTDIDGLMSASDKSKLDDADNTYALKSKYGDTSINIGRKDGTTVGGFSTAVGRDTTASGQYSHAEGYGTTASGQYSHVSGKETKALHSGEAAFGMYNVSNDDTLFSIGDGNSNVQHNAFEITTTSGKLHDKDIATTDLIPTSLPANGGTADTARQVISSSSKVKLYEDNEGGNLELVAPDGVHYMQMDLYNNETFRMYFDGGDEIVYPLTYDFTAKKLNINGDADTVDGKHADSFALKTDIPTSLPANGGNADTLDGKHADDFVQFADEMIINNIRINANQHKISDIDYRWSIWADGEGGNFELTAPDGSHFMQMDLYNSTDFRMFFGDRTTGELNFPFYYKSDTGKIELNGTSDIYTVLNKPYVTGEGNCGNVVTATAMDLQIFDFTPSAVICQIANGSAFFAETIQNGFRVSLVPTDNGKILKYIAFK